MDMADPTDEPFFMDMDDAHPGDTADTTMISEDKSDTNIATQWQCSECSFTSETACDMNEHTMEIHMDPEVKKPSKIAKHQCSECNLYSADSEDKIMRHIRRVHRGENPYQCHICDYSTYNKTLFDEHVRIHKGIKPFKCSQCPYRSASKKNAKKHEHIHRPTNPNRCLQCGFIARNQVSLKVHKRDMNHYSESEPVEFYHICPKCGLKFVDKNVWENHRKRRKTCVYCEAIVCQQLMARHVEAAHTDVKPRKRPKRKKLGFICQICDWTSNYPARILLHLIHHPKQIVNPKWDVSILLKNGIKIPPNIDGM